MDGKRIALGLALGLGIGGAGMGALTLAYAAGRAAPAPAQVIAAEAPPAAPQVAPAAVVPVVAEPEPEPLSPGAALAVQALADAERFRALEGRARTQALADFAPTGEPSYAALERGVAAHVGERVCYRGTVQEIFDTENGTQMRVALRSYGQDVIWVIAVARPADDVLARSRVTLCGYVLGQHTYQSQAGWNISLPLIAAAWVERRR